MIGSWLDGGHVNEGQVGTTISVVLWPVGVGATGSQTEWKSIRNQFFCSSEGIDLNGCSHATFYQWRIECIDANGVIMVTKGPDSDVGLHECRPEGWQQLVSLCAGMGGASMGAKAAGFSTKVSCDHSQLACETLERTSDSVVIQGDFGSIAVAQAIHKEKGNLRMLLECGFPCQPFSRLGDGKSFGDPRSFTFVKALRCAWLWQSLGVVLECVDTVYDNEEVGRLLDEFCQLMSFRRHERVLHLHESWPSKRSRWWCILGQASWDSLCLPPMPKTCWTQIRHIIPDWPVWSAAEEEQLRWTSEEVQKYGDTNYGNPQRTLALSGIAPTALHSVGNHFSGCPCGCRSGPLSDGRLRRGGLHGIEVVSGQPERFARHPHPQELGLLNGITPNFVYDSDLRAALCLIGQVASPLQSLWAFLHLKSAIDQHELSHSGHGTLVGEEATYFRLYCADMLEARQVLWPIGDASDVGRCQIWTGEGAPIDLWFTPGTCVREVLEAQGRLTDQPGVWRVEKGGQILSVNARLCDGDLLNLRRSHSQWLGPDPFAGTVNATFEFQGESRTFEIRRGAFSF